MVKRRNLARKGLNLRSLSLVDDKEGPNGKKKEEDLYTKTMRTKKLRKCEEKGSCKNLSRKCLSCISYSFGANSLSNSICKYHIFLKVHSKLWSLDT